MLRATLIALLLQALPAAGQQPAAKAAVAGVVVHSGTGEPIPNVRVTLARTDAPLGPFGELLAGDHPSGEVTIPGDFLAEMAVQIAADPNPGEPGAAAAAAALAALPVAEIEEIIAGPADGLAVVFKSMPPTLSDERGRFAFAGVEPGKYRLIFSGAGHARQNYGQRTFGGVGIPLVLGAGQARTDIVMPMIQTGAVNGRILDTTGRPSAGVPVQLVRFSYDETGERKPQPAASTQTDDRGEYRMYRLSPGHYYLNAGNPPRDYRPPYFSPGLGGGYVSPNRIVQDYALTYYPGVEDVNAASAINVQPGADLSGIDLSLGTQQYYRVRGRVMDPRTGQPPAFAIIGISPQSPDLPAVFGVPGDSYNPADGSFELVHVSPGAYMVTANLRNPSPVPPGPDFSGMSPAERNAYFESIRDAEFARPKASAAVTVIHSDVEGVALMLGTGASISGRVRIDPATSGPAPRFDFLQIHLRKADGAPLTSTITPRPEPIKGDGTFRIDNVWPEEYRLSAAGLPSGFYIKEARLGDADVLNSVLHFPIADSSTLDIVISPNVGEVRGTAVDQSGRSAPGVQVVLIPSRRERTDLFRPVTSDSAGHFTIAAVAPGEYRLAAWEAIEPYAFFDPELIKQAEQRGKSVHVAELSRQTVDVSLMPSVP